MRKLKIYIMKYLTRHLFNGVWEDDIFRKVGNKVLYKGRVIDDVKKDAIRDDAERFQQSVIWKALKDECIYQANLKQFKSVTSEIDALAGRMMLLNLEIIDKVIIKLKNL